MSCLFMSLTYFLKKDARDIRDIICNYLENNGKLIDDLDTEFILSLDISKVDYIREMRKETTWGGAIEIQATCNIWNVKILVYNIRENNNIQVITFIPINSTHINTIKISWNGSHYEAILN